MTNDVLVVKSVLKNLLNNYELMTDEQIEAIKTRLHLVLSYQQDIFYEL